MSDDTATKKQRRAASSRGDSSAAFLLAQVGAHAAAAFGGRLVALGLTPPHAGILRALGAAEGMSQQALCRHLSMMPSRLVVLLDELEERRLVERRDDPDDRRSYALYLTDAGHAMLGEIAAIARAHNEAICAGLSAEQRKSLVALLQQVADTQGLVPGVHPGYRRLGGKGGGAAK